MKKNLKTPKYPKVHRMDQRSDEWKEIRKGKMTASHAATIATNGKGLETYIYELLAEKYSNNTEEGFVGFDMKRGIELEEQARQTYEIEYEPVEQVGFVEMDEYTGCSPDGLVGESKGMEIKCVNDVNFFRLMVDGRDAIESKYVWQVQMNLLVTGRDSWDLVFYNPNFEKNILVFEFCGDTEKQAKILKGIERGKQLIQAIEKKLCKKNGNTK